MGSAISKRMQLLLEWKDREFQSGVDRSKRGMDELKKRALQVAKAILATTAAVVGLTAGLLKLIKQGSEVKSVQESFRGFISTASMAPDTLDKVRAAVRGTISDIDLMNSSVMALASGLDKTRLVEFWEKAKQRGDVISKDTRFVFESLTIGMTKLEVETLKTIGITIRAEDVYKQYAAAIGKTQAQLTTYDRRIAFSIALEEKYRKETYAVGDVTTRVREKFQQLGASVKNLWNKFVVMVAESPRVQKFLTMLIGRSDDAKTKLDELEPKIQSTTDAFIELLGKAEQTAKMLYRFRSAIYAVAGGLAAAKISGWIIGLVSALKVGGSAAMAASGWIGVIVGGLILLANNYKTVLNSILELVDSFNRVVYGAFGSILEGVKWLLNALDKITPGTIVKDWAEDVQKGIDFFAEQTLGKTYIDTLQEKISGWPEFNIWSVLFPKDKQDPSVIEEEKRAIGGLWKGFDTFQAAKIPAPEFAKAAAPKRDREKLAMLDEDEQAFIDSWDRRVEYAQTASDILLSIEEGRYLSNSELWEIERIDFLRNMQIREQSYSAGYQAMGQYSERFFARNAKMGRILNAMLIRGATEAVASWIDAKTKEWRYQAAEGTIQALSFAAKGQWGAAATMGLVAAKWAALAGGATIAAGGVRYGGQQKAESMMTEQETQWEEAAGGGDEDMKRQKREASGIVKTRPIHINVYSTANFNSGYMIFGDSETAAGELYSEHFRDRIESDIESGAIQIA